MSPRIALVFVSLSACAGLQERPLVAHGYYTHADRFVSVAAPGYKAINIRYKDVLPHTPGAAPPLLLVHGLQTSSYSWRYNLEALARTRRVIALDLPGSGRSDHPADFGYSPEHMADFLEAFRATLALSDPAFAEVDVVGNSLGGVYAAMFAARHRAHVRKLIVVHAPGFQRQGPFWEVERMRRGELPEWTARFFGPWMVRKYLLYYRPDILSQEEVTEFSLPFADDEGRRAFWHIMVESLNPETAAALPSALLQVQTPTLLVWATKDTLIPAWTGHLWNQHISGSELVWIAESSHFPQVEAPRATEAAVLAFLDRQ